MSSCDVDFSSENLFYLVVWLSSAVHHSALILEVLQDKTAIRSCLLQDDNEKEEEKRMMDLREQGRE